MLGVGGGGACYASLSFSAAARGVNKMLLQFMLLQFFEICGGFGGKVATSQQMSLAPRQITENPQVLNLKL